VFEVIFFLAKAGIIISLIVSSADKLNQFNQKAAQWLKEGKLLEGLHDEGLGVEA